MAERKRYTVEEFEWLISEGILEEDERSELIRGEIIEMHLVDHPHASCVSQLELLLHEALGRRAYVWSQNPVRLDDYSRPQPDVILLKWQEDRYREKRPTPDDALLVIEVASESLSYDLILKTVLYAEAGIREYWIINIKNHAFHIYSEPTNGMYRTMWTGGLGGVVSLPGDLNAEIDFSELL
jgi:Uma2 family endonuclease